MLARRLARILFMSSATRRSWSSLYPSPKRLNERKVAWATSLNAARMRANNLTMYLLLDQKEEDLCAVSLVLIVCEGTRSTQYQLSLFWCVSNRWSAERLLKQQGCHRARSGIRRFQHHPSIPGGYSDTFGSLSGLSWLLGPVCSTCYGDLGQDDPTRVAFCALFFSQQTSASRKGVILPLDTSRNDFYHPRASCAYGVEKRFPTNGILPGPLITQLEEKKMSLHVSLCRNNISSALLSLASYDYIQTRIRHWPPFASSKFFHPGLMFFLSYSYFTA